MKHRSITVVLVIFALLAAGCGARLTDEQIAAATASGSAGTGGATAGGATSGAGGAASGGGTGGAVAGAPGAATGGGAAGGDAAAGGSGDGGGGAVAPGGGGGSCAPEPGHSDVGLTDTQVVIGNVSTITGPIAGFGTTGLNAVKAYVNYRNATGGVCGRQLVLETGDDRLDAGTNRSETQRLATSVFAFVGGTTVVDNGGATVLAGTNISDVSLSIGEQRAALPNNFSPNPLNPNAPGNAATPIMQYFREQGATSAAIVFPAQSDARARALGFRHDMGEAGITDVREYEVAITETNYVSVATDIKNRGIQLVVTTLEVSGMARLAQAFQQVGYQPQFPFYGSQAYGQKFIELAGEAANGTTIGVSHAIFEDTNNVPVQTLLEWYQRTAPGSDPDFFAVMAWAAADIFARALEAAGPAPTRDSVLAQLQAMTNYTGDGLMAPRNPAGKQMGGCYAIVTIQDLQWRRVTPAEGFQGSC